MSRTGGGHLFWLAIAGAGITLRYQRARDG